MTYGRLCEPRISVVICNFNYAQFVGSAIKSVLAQTRPAFELVVVDDGSTDTSVDVIQPFVSKGVCLIRQANGGQIAAYNTGFAQTQGDVILFLDADDLLLPEALDEVAKKFIDGIVKVHFRLELVGPLGQVLGSTIPRHLAIGEVASRLVRKGVPHASPPASGNAYRREVLRLLFPLPTNQHDRHGADLFCIYGSTLYGSVGACERTLGQYRVHHLPKTSAGLNFGNAEQGHRLSERVQARTSLFSSWIAKRSSGLFVVPEHWVDFSVEKTAYAASVLLNPAGRPTPWTAWPAFRKVLRAIWWQDGLGIGRRLGLLAWAFLLLVAPRALAMRAARYVCDPASRV